jgi:DNA polymerase-3 subunit delta'
MARRTTTTKSGGKSAMKSAGTSGVGSTDPDAPSNEVTPESGVFVPVPIAIDVLIGQQHAVGTLDAAMSSGRVHHAWIFHGPPGIGKFTAAVAFASILLDPTSDMGLTGGVRPDPNSAVQQLLAQRAHPDLHVVVKELARFSSDASVRSSKLATIPKKVIEDFLLKPAAMAPARLEHGLASKVFVIDEAELLDRSATNAPSQNAMLKTLEEPSPGTVIILVTSNEDRLLPTIRSRCQRVAFGSLDGEQMQAWLGRSSADPRLASYFAAPEHVRESALGFAAGSPGRLLTAVETGMLEWFEMLDGPLAELDRGEYPPALPQMMADLVESWAKNFVATHTNASKDSANRDAARQLFGLLGARYQSQLRAGVRHSGASSNAHRLAALADAIDIIGRAQRDLDTNVTFGFVSQRMVSGLATTLIAAN